MLLIAAGQLGANDPIPYWIVFACYITIGLGTAFGGWRIVKTMGQRITKIRPVGGFCAELSGSVALFLATARVIAPEVSAQKPPMGWSLVILLPMVLTMRQPPNIVPRPIAR